MTFQLECPAGCGNALSFGVVKTIAGVAWLMEPEPGQPLEYNGHTDILHATERTVRNLEGWPKLKCLDRTHGSHEGCGHTWYEPRLKDQL